MQKHNDHLISVSAGVRHALSQLNVLAADAILFVVDEKGRLIGSLTDGDLRRGFIKGLGFDDSLVDFLNPTPRRILKGSSSVETVIEYRNNNFRIIPVVDIENRLISVINFRLQKSYLPIDAIIMAGGRGERLRPLTDSVPKPLLKIGEKPIIEHGLDRLIYYGVSEFYISVRYLAEQLQDHLGDGSTKQVRIRYLLEDEPLGTIGCISKIDSFCHDYVLVTNSDVLTNIDYEDFFLSFIESGADFSVVTIPYSVDVPYAVLETSNGHVMSFKEKPTYTYYSNGGIYLLKREVVELVPRDLHYNATDLMELLINMGKKIYSYPLHGYWLDIGKKEDFEKAQIDIKHVKFS